MSISEEKTRCCVCNLFSSEHDPQDKYQGHQDHGQTGAGVQGPGPAGPPGAAALGLVLGSIVALVGLAGSKNPLMKLPKLICAVYVTVVRGTPMALQLFIMAFVVFAIRGFPLVVTAIIAFGVNSGAYVSENIRAGILSVDIGQTEAGRSLGLNYLDTMRFIVVPQAFKNILPSLGNEFITLFKDTSLVQAIGGMEMLYYAYTIGGRTFDYMPPLLGIALMYLLIVIVFTWLQGMLERRLRESDRR